MKYFMVLFLSALVINAAYAKKSKRTWDYPLNYYKNFEVTGSEDFLEFTFDLRKDADVIKEFNNNEETGIIGYLLYEGGNIVIDESDIPTHVRNSDGQLDKIINGLLPSASMGKSLVSYVTGHAISEGYIESVN